MIKLKPKYISLSALFWEGLIDFKIKVVSPEEQQNIVDYCNNNCW